MSETNEEVKVTKDEKTGDTIMKKPTRYKRLEPTAQELAAEEELKAREEANGLATEEVEEVQPWAAIKRERSLDYFARKKAGPPYQKQNPPSNPKIQIRYPVTKTYNIKDLYLLAIELNTLPML